MQVSKNVYVLIMVMLLMGCSQKSDDTAMVETTSTTHKPDVAAVQVQEGEALFQQNCSQCHALSGRGDYLKDIPVTLLTRRSTQELMEWIKGSDKHREMPNFDNLSGSERESLALFLHSRILK